MTDDEAPPAKKKPKVILNEEIRQELNRPVKGMTWGRFKELSQLEDSGENLEFAEGEREDYERFKTSLDRQREALHNSTFGNLAKNLERFKIPESLAPKLQYRSPNAFMESQLEEIAGTLVEQRQQEERNSEHLRLMSETLVEAKAARESADLQAGRQAKMNHWLTVLGIFLAAVSSISAGPVVIEFWRWLSQ